MNRITTTTPRKPTQRAFEDWRTTWAARSGVSSTARTDGAAVNRSTGATSAGGRGTGSRSAGSSPSGSRPDVSLTEALVGGIGGRSSDAARRGAWRDQAGLAERDGQRSEGDLAGVDGQHAGAVDGDREAIHPARRRAVGGAVGLDPEPVVARAVTRALEPEVLEARVRLATEVRAALVEGADVEPCTIARRVLTRQEPLLTGVEQDHEGARLGVVGGEAFLDRQRRVLQLDRVQVADSD